MVLSLVQRLLSVTLFSTILLALSGCRSYAPSPIVWDEEARLWSQAATNTEPVTLVQACRIALALNPGINELRLARQSAERLVLDTGWWDDPEFDLDGLRILRNVSHPWLGSAGVSFTLPLNGVPGIEKRAAKHYSRADALAVTAAEQALVSEVALLWTACARDKRNAAVQREYRSRLLAHERRVRDLIAAGELPKSEEERIVQQRITLDLECACCGPEALARYQELIRLMGINPDPPLALTLEMEEAAWPRIGAEPERDVDLARHPKVLEKLARHQAGEEELRAEIRRQYPDLKIGPLLGYEDGSTRAGATLSFSIPLWNRNRKAITVAENARDGARLDALNEWRALSANWRQASGIAEVASARERQTREMLLPEAISAAERTDKMFEQGEADVLALLAADEVVYNAKLAAINARAALNEARIKLELFSIIDPPQDVEPLLNTQGGDK